MPAHPCGQRAGQPAVDLRDLEKPSADDTITIEGISLPRRHPTTLFGDGGAAKSYLALYVAGGIAQKGMSVAFFDWELAGEDHRDRLERLFGPAMPPIIYARCERPLVHELDRLRRIVREHEIDFAVYDSIAFACDGPPESAEIAGKYFRAVRQIGPGSLHVAHVNKSDNGDQKPFGSAFWHNGSRMTWFAKLVDSPSAGKSISLGLFNRKSNLGRIQSPVGFRVEFKYNRTFFNREDVAEVPDLADKMPLRQRIIHLLRAGSLPIDQVAQELDAKPDTVKKTVRRYKDIFTVLDGGQVALLQRVG